MRALFFIDQVVLRTLFFDWSGFLRTFFIGSVCVSHTFVFRQTSPYNVINVKSGDECLLGAEDEAKACFNLLVEFTIA